MEPFSTNGNLDLLKRAGFKDTLTVMKHLCFEGFLAINNLNSEKIFPRKKYYR